MLLLLFLIITVKLHAFVALVAVSLLVALVNARDVDTGLGIPV